MDPSPTAQPASSKKVWIYRAPLLVILAVAILGLIFDYSQRNAQQSAYRTVGNLVPSDESKIVQDEELWPSVVHEALGREPDATPVNTPKELQELYRWRGAFYTYSVRVVYRRDFANQPQHVLKEAHSE